MSRSIDILYVEPGKPPELRAINPDSLDDSCRLCNTDMIEMRHPFPMRQNVVLVCDEEGKLNHNRNRPNRRIPELGDVIYGPFYFATEVAARNPEDGMELESLSVRDAAWLMGRFGDPSGGF
jgi:hypothetical protein